MRWVSRIFVGNKELKFLNMDKPISGIKLILNDGTVIEGYDNIVKLYMSREVYGMSEPYYITLSRTILIATYDELTIEYESCITFDEVVQAKTPLYNVKYYQGICNSGKWFTEVLENVYESGGSSRMLTGLRLEDTVKDVPVVRIIMEHWDDVFLQGSSEFIYIPRNYRERFKFSITGSLRTYIAKRVLVG